MKKLILILLLVSAFASAQTLLTEGFAYTASGTDGLAKQSALWNKLNTGDSIFVTSGSLSYSGYATSGNKIAFDGTGSDAWRQFTSQTTAGTTVYYSFLLKVTGLGSMNTTGGYFTGVLQDANTTTFGATVWLRSDGGTGYNIGVNPRTTALNTAWVTGSKTVGTTYLVVVLYSIVSSTANDVVKIWINPSLGLGSEPTADASATNTGTDLTSVARVFIRQDAAAATPLIEMDEVNVSLDWSDAALPVELNSFTATAKGTGVELSWKTATEVNNKGFEVEKNVNGTWNKIGFVEGNGTSNAPKSYSYTDASAKGSVSYRLMQIDNNGNFKYSSTVNANVLTSAADYQLSQNFPNPFNPNTNITFAMKTAEHVNVTVYNALGQVVATLFNDVATANQMYTLNFDGKNLSSGTYFYSLRSASRNEVRKMLLSK